MARTAALVHNRRKRQEAATANRSRYRALQMEVCDADDRPLFACGGLWDTEERDYTKPAGECVVVTLAPSQHEAGPDFLEWLELHRTIRELVRAGTHTYDDAIDEVWQDDPVFTMLWYGGRRAGKSWLACLAVALFAIAVPGARIVMVSPQQKHTLELYEVLLTLLAAEWRDWQEGKQRFVLINGTVIELYTGNRQQLKLGKCDLVVVNECQEQKKQTSKDVMLNTADVGGLAILTCNPPRSPIGAWVQELYNQIKAGERPDCRKHFLDWELNPHTSRRKILAEAEGMSELERRREIDGDMDVPIGSMVLSSFGQHNIIDRVPVSWRDLDVTTEICERYFETPGIETMAGLDFDKLAGCSATAIKWFLRELGGCLEDAIMVVLAGRRWKDREERFFGADLREWKDQYGRRIFSSPETTLFVGDASGARQSTYRKRRSGDPDVVDPPSFQRLRDAGWQNIVCPVPDSDKNPSRNDRFDCTRDVLRPKFGLGPRVLFVSGAHEVIVSNENCPVEGSETGNPKRRSEFAHLIDTWSYPAWRRWGADWIARQLALRDDRPREAIGVRLEKRRPRAYGGLR